MANHWHYNRSIFQVMVYSEGKQNLYGSKRKLGPINFKFHFSLLGGKENDWISFRGIWKMTENLTKHRRCSNYLIKAFLLSGIDVNNNSFIEWNYCTLYNLVQNEVYLTVWDISSSSSSQSWQTITLGRQHVS